MAFVTKPCVIITCDGCKEPLQNGDGITLHWDTEAEAEGWLAEYEWVQRPGMMLCPECRWLHPYGNHPSVLLDEGSGIFKCRLCAGGIWADDGERIIATEAGFLCPVCIEKLLD